MACTILRICSFTAYFVRGSYNFTMKYAIVIPDGAADEPQPSLGNSTPLQAARLPNMDRAVSLGITGLMNNVPKPLTPASDVATLSLFGYDPLEVYTGRAPLEAAALGVTLGPGDWAIRCNLVHVADGLMRDFTAGHISTEEGSQLIDALAPSLKPVPIRDETGRIIGHIKHNLELHPGVSYRNLLVVRNADSHFGDNLVTQPPHDIPDRPVNQYLPTGTGNELLRELMDQSKAIFRDHAVNETRRAAGRRDATQIWLWGQGRAPSLTKFADRYGKRGAITSGVDLVRGVGVLLGWDRLDHPAVTDYLNNDYARQAELAIAALDSHDLVCVHVEAPDEASHEGRADAKVEAIERIDRHIVGPLLDALPSHGDWRLLIAPDHRTPLRTRAHSYGAVPFAVAGTGVPAGGPTAYDEDTAAATGRTFDPGWRLMEWFLRR
jgi:2,3-bisphosphoglycerate-independent phosphoglycerate mutase